jgi:hypothetical protein
VAIANLGLAACALGNRQVLLAAGNEQARDLGRGLVQRYRNAHSYSDRGVMVVTSEGGPDAPPCAREQRLEFTTAFDRTTDAFKLEVQRAWNCLTGGGRMVIWAPPTGPARNWETWGHSIKEEPFRAALARLAGVCEGISAKVPELLLDGTDFTRLHSDFEQVDLDGTEEVRGTHCTRLTTRDGNREATYWISNDHVLLRLRERVRLTAGDLSGTPQPSPRHLEAPVVFQAMTDFYPAFDETLDPSRFSFALPERGESR